MDFRQDIILLLKDCYCSYTERPFAHNQILQCQVGWCKSLYLTNVFTLTWGIRENLWEVNVELSHGNTGTQECMHDVSQSEFITSSLKTNLKKHHCGAKRINLLLFQSVGLFSVLVTLVPCRGQLEGVGWLLSIHSLQTESGVGWFDGGYEAIGTSPRVRLTTVDSKHGWSTNVLGTLWWEKYGWGRQFESQGVSMIAAFRSCFKLLPI